VSGERLRLPSGSASQRAAATDTRSAVAFSNKRTLRCHLLLFVVFMDCYSLNFMRTLLYYYYYYHYYHSFSIESRLAAYIFHL